MFVSHPIECCRACCLQDQLSHPNTNTIVDMLHHTATLDPSGEHLCFSRSQRLSTTLCAFFFCMRSSKLSCDASANNFIVAQTRARRWTCVCNDRCSARHQVAHHSTSSTKDVARTSLKRLARRISTSRLAHPPDSTCLVWDLIQ